MAVLIKKKNSNTLFTCQQKEKHAQVFNIKTFVSAVTGAKKTESRKRGSDIALDLISHSLYPSSSYLHEWTFVSLETPQALQAAGTTCPLLCIPNCTFSHNKNVQENSFWQPLTQRIILPVPEPYSIIFTALIVSRNKKVFESIMLPSCPTLEQQLTWGVSREQSRNSFQTIPSYKNTILMQ